MSNEPTISDVNKKVDDLSNKVDVVLEAIGEFSNKVDGRFNRVEVRLESLENRQDDIKKRLTCVESQMVTKAYLDDKLVDLKADLTVVMRKEDHKLESLTRLLAQKKVISDGEAEKILSLDPFPQKA